MTNTETLTVAQVAEMQLRGSLLLLEDAKEEAAARVAAGDFIYLAKWNIGEYVRLQFRVRALTLIAERGEDAVVLLLSGPVSDTSTTSGAFDRAVAEAERVEALSLLRVFRAYLSPEKLVELVERIY